MQTWIDAAVQFFVRTALRIFFSEITVIGAERLPKSGGFLLVANHANAIIDPGLLLGFLPRPMRFLAKSTLWAHPIMRGFLVAARAVPVHRQQDEGVDTNKNIQTFARCWDALAEGEPIALFPEGITHSESELQPLKTGAARIVMGAEDQHPGLCIPVVPVGMTFDAKDRFRSRVLVFVGNQLDSVAARKDHPDDERAAVRALTAEIRDALEEVTLNYPSWEEASLVEQAAEIYLHGREHDVSAPTQEESFETKRLFAKAYPRAKENSPRQVEKVVKAVQSYERLLEAVQLTDLKVMSRARVGFNRWWQLLRLPLAAIGLLLNWVPYRLCGWVGNFAKQAPDQPATLKIFTGIVLFPLCWGLETWWAGEAAGQAGAILMLLLAPLSGHVIMRFRERRRSVVEEARVRKILASAEGLEGELKERRKLVIQELTRLRDLNPTLV